MENKLPADVQARIKADADQYAFVVPYDGSKKFYNDDKLEGYLAGATAENTRFQPMIDALDQFISFHESGLLPAKHVYEKAIAVRKQWKEGKEVGHVMGSNEAVFEVKRMSNGMGTSNLLIVIDEAIQDVYIGSLLIVPFALGYKDPIKVKVLVGENGKPIATNINTCIVTEYIYY